jgi:hypothetical protein
MSVEFLHGRPLSADELEMIRQVSTTLPRSTLKSAASSLATGRTYLRSFRRKRNDREEIEPLVVSRHESWQLPVTGLGRQ